jgi:hypothetical protein
LRNVCIHSSGLLLFEPLGDDDDTAVEHIPDMQLFLSSTISSATVRYAYPVTIMRNAIYPPQFQQSSSPHFTPLLACGRPMSQIGHHIFESVLAVFVTIKAAALETTSNLHVLLSSHYFSPPFPSFSTTQKENLLRSVETSAITQNPISVGRFLVGSIQDKRVPL